MYFDIRTIGGNIMSKFIDNIKNEINKLDNLKSTENGAIGYKESGKALTDINYKVSSFRNSDEDEIIEAFDKAYYENRKLAVKWLFFARDIREGLGERRLFRICYKRLYELDSILFLMNLDNISEYGRYDDLISFVGINNEIDEHIVGIVRRQLNKDLKSVEENRPISLLAKWMPSENASSKETKYLAKRMIKLLEMSPRKYRLMLSKLRSYSNVIEVKTCANKWNEIDYEKVPSLANLKYKDAFMKHDKDRRVEYLESVAKGGAKLNMKVATPVDVVARYGSWFVKDYDETLELAWKNLKDVMVEDTLVVADGSGSMTVPVTNKVMALDVANALAIYTSEHNSSDFKNKYITFSNRPKFVEFGENDSLKKKLEIANEHNEISNTDIEAVFDLILGTAIDNKIPKNEMIKNVLIISDMEFDSAQRSWYSTDSLLTKSLFEEIKNRYERNGYKLPKLIFWNVNSRTKTIPMTENEMGVILISGFSQNTLKMVMTNETDPYKVLVETITSERYDKIIA